MENNKREISLKRAEELKSRIEDYLEAKKTISKGLENQEALIERKNKILSVLGGTEEDWNNYKWQLCFCSGSPIGSAHRRYCRPNESYPDKYNY